MAARKAMVMGSSAYDLERIGAIPEIPLERPDEGAIRRERERAYDRPDTREGAKQRVKTRARAKAANGQYISVFAIVGSLCVTALIILMLLAYSQLAVITAETAELENSLTELENENDSLSAQYDSAFSMTELEDYARNVLGMTEPAEGQIYYIENNLGDEAVILEQDSVKDFGVLSAITSFFKSLVE